ncbi:uncharacterized protein Z519_03709 [Cladophialophora bantiana CBS 173.52]|uniref:Transcription factor domain-containing protein n=1 Tax=Cladophialophora bantiana (strain ATCC 10958 / CBS 173.52 / CDC B-1940 / NIH 8579) TaxID=1442370 RepID=A0A0D2HVZ5_CLAB1|nr:uncharacterized protein Z519_03709 [Cladophialophora bantiana CBS 173.52]KIW95125.1 hypothetical protein Z519_03709 [Cladophialophora bantiana CBS 173.52]
MPFRAVILRQGRTQGLQSSSGMDTEALFTSIEDLQRKLDEFKSQLQGATAPELPGSAFPSPPEAFQQPHNSDRNEVDEPAPVKRQPDPDTLHVYAGPTSYAFGMVTADARLSNLTPSSRDFTTIDSPSPTPIEERGCPNGPAQPVEAWEIHGETSLERFSVEDAVQCLDTFQDVFGVLHPLPQLEKIRSSLPSLLRSAKRSLWSQPTTPGHCGLLEMLKIILGIALVAQIGGRTKLSDTLYQSVEPTIVSAVFQHSISHDFRALLLLVAMYHFSNEDLVLGSRAIMYAARTAVEEGLYRIEKLSVIVPDEKERQAIIRQLWSLFVLDRQFNFAAGLPHHLNDSDVDEGYLAAMVNYVIFGAQAWNSLVNRNLLASGQAPSKDSMNFFYYQVHQWHQDLDPSVRFDTATIESDDHNFFTSTSDEVEVYRKTLLYLRSNQIQILVLRPILIYPQTARSNTALVMEAITLAKKSIRTLRLLSSETNLYRTRQALFNHFLSSALAVLFLAAAYDAETRANKAALPDSAATLLGDTTSELQQGLDLIDYHRSHSQSAARLWTRFNRPRQQLIRLDILQGTAGTRHQRDKHPHHGPTGEDRHEISQEDDYCPDGTVADADTETCGERDLIPHLDAPVPIGFDPANFDPDNSLLWLDWFDGAFMDSSVPFGMPAWM